jgi:hypothetical protein
MRKGNGKGGRIRKSKEKIEERKGKINAIWVEIVTNRFHEDYIPKYIGRWKISILKIIVFDQNLDAGLFFCYFFYFIQNRNKYCVI